MDESLDARERLLREGESSEKLFAAPKSRRTLLHIVGGIVIAALLFSAGFYCGLKAGSGGQSQQLLPGVVPRVSIGNVERTFEQDERFMKPPPANGAPEPVWDSMLPLGLGYVRNSEILETESVATISAMHQLHCLYTVRRIYFSSTSGEDSLESFDNGIDRHAHISHCFEYLRQAIMCNADSSLEPFETPDGGFPGMGFARQCRDYDALKHFAERWRIMDVESFILNDAQHNISFNGSS